MKWNKIMYMLFTYKFGEMQSDVKIEIWDENNRRERDVEIK